MDRNRIYFKLRELCNKFPMCGVCPIKSISSKHKCGNGYVYFLDSNPVPLSEALKYYSIIFGEHNLRALIEEKKGEHKYEKWL